MRDEPVYGPWCFIAIITVALGCAALLGPCMMAVALLLALFAYGGFAAWFSRRPPPALANQYEATTEGGRDWGWVRADDGSDRHIWNALLQRLPAGARVHISEVSGGWASVDVLCGALRRVEVAAPPCGATWRTLVGPVALAAASLPLALLVAWAVAQAPPADAVVGLWRFTFAAGAAALHQFARERFSPGAFLGVGIAATLLGRLASDGAEPIGPACAEATVLAAGFALAAATALLRAVRWAWEVSGWPAVRAEVYRERVCGDEVLVALRFEAGGSLWFGTCWLRVGAAIYGTDEHAWVSVDARTPCRFVLLRPGMSAEEASQAVALP